MFRRFSLGFLDISIQNLSFDGWMKGVAGESGSIIYTSKSKSSVQGTEELSYSMCGFASL